VLIVVIATTWLVRGLGARNMPDLAIWNTYSLESEFHARNYPDGISFAQYQQLEADLDEELKEKIYLSSDASSQGQFNRYNKSSPVYSGLTGQDWNRSFERCPRFFRDRDCTSWRCVYPETGPFQQVLNMRDWRTG